MMLCFFLSPFRRWENGVEKSVGRKQWRNRESNAEKREINLKRLRCKSDDVPAQTWSRLSWNEVRSQLSPSHFEYDPPPFLSTSIRFSVFSPLFIYFLFINTVFILPHSSIPALEVHDLFISDIKERKKNKERKKKIRKGPIYSIELWKLTSNCLTAWFH